MRKYFLGILFCGIQFIHSTAQADDTPIKKYYGCYKVLKWKGTGSYQHFKPVTLEIEKEGFGPYQLADRTRLGGSMFAFCIHGGGMRFCQTLFAYDAYGSCGLIKKGGEFCLYAGEACDITRDGGITCGGHVEHVEVIKDAENRLNINGSRLFNYPVYSLEDRAGVEAVVEPMPFNQDGDCRP